MGKTSVRAIARAARAEDERARRMAVVTRDTVHNPAPSKAARATAGALRGVTLDSFVNFQQRMGIGADNALSSGTYGFNPITRNRNLVEWIHRGSWLGGVAVDCVADDMTRAGVNLLGQVDPNDAERLQRSVVSLGAWHAINECIKWGRLYGGGIAVALVDGQDPRTPLRLETIGPGQFKGLLALDRWMLEPTLEDLVTEYGPRLGTPKYYRVQANAPALKYQSVHYSRVLFRHVGLELPYQQRLIENLWGLSVLERMFDRMVAFDSASTGMAQLVYKSYLRTLKVKDLRQVVAAGGDTLNGLLLYVETMRRMQSMEGMTVIDAEDEVEVQQHQAMSGMADALDRFAEQVSGALQIPLTRLLGKAGGGLNGTNGADLQLYYDQIRQRQNQDMLAGVAATFRLTAASLGMPLPPDFSVEFKSLWEMSDTDKASVAGTTTDAITKAMDAGVFGRKTALRELRQQSTRTGVFTNITEEMIDEADDEVGPPPGAEGMIGPDGQPLPGMPPGMGPPGMGDDDEEATAAGPEGEEGQVDQGARRRARLQVAPPGGGEEGGGDGPVDGPQRPTAAGADARGRSQLVR